MSKKLSKMTTEEKYQAAKQAKAEGKYETVEEASRAFEISPATFYIYQQKEKERVKASPAAVGFDDEYSGREVNQIIEENQKLRAVAKEKSDMVEALQAQVTKLKDKVIDLIMVKG